MQNQPSPGVMFGSLELLLQSVALVGEQDDTLTQLADQVAGVRRSVHLAEALRGAQLPAQHTARA